MPKTSNRLVLMDIWISRDRFYLVLGAGGVIRVRTAAGPGLPVRSTGVTATASASLGASKRVSYGVRTAAFFHVVPVRVWTAQNRTGEPGLAAALPGAHVIFCPERERIGATCGGLLPGIQGEAGTSAGS